MTAPSNANTSGLEVVAWRWHHHTQPGLWSVTTDDSVLSDPYCVSELLVTAASAQARIAELEALVESYRRTADLEARDGDAAEARADRLAKALEPFARVARWARLCGMSDLEKATAKYAKRNLFWDQFSAADAALSGDTDHAG